MRELQMDLCSTYHVAMQIANQTADVADNVEQEEEEAGNSRNARGAEDDGEETLQ